MTQPFRSGDQYDSTIWSGVTLLLKEDRIEASTPEQLYALSSAIHPGGFSYTNRIVNWRVPLTYQCDDPVRDIIEHCKEWGCDAKDTIGLITAAKLTHAAVAEVEEIGLSCYAARLSGLGMQLEQACRAVPFPHTPLERSIRLF